MGTMFLLGHTSKSKRILKYKFGRKLDFESSRSSNLLKRIPKIHQNYILARPPRI
jgi:hypothetical protein